MESQALYQGALARGGWLCILARMVRPTSYQGGEGPSKGQEPRSRPGESEGGRGRAQLSVHPGGLQSSSQPLEAEEHLRILKLALSSKLSLSLSSGVFLSSLLFPSVFLNIIFYLPLLFSSLV